jgi:hypothetical protein
MQGLVRLGHQDKGIVVAQAHQLQVRAEEVLAVRV